MRVFFTLLLIYTVYFSNGQEVVTIAGIIEVIGAADGPAFESTFNNPHGIAADDVGNVYVVDRFGHKVRKYTQDGNVTTLAGSGIPGAADGTGVNATFNEPWGVCVGNDGFIYVADTRNNLIRKISPDGEVSTFAGSGNFGSTNGQGTSASFGNPTGLEMDEFGNLYVADHLTHVIRKISPTGYVSTLAGVPGSPGHVDGNGANSLFYRPYGLTLDINGDVLVADEWNHRIRRVTPGGDVTTIAGRGVIGHVDGLPDDSEFNYPWDITVDDSGNIYVADGYNQVIRKLVPTGSIPESYEVSTYVGKSGESGGTDGYGTNAEFNAATSIHFWPQTGEIFIADAYNELIRKIIDLNRPYVNLSLFNQGGGEPGNPDSNYYCVGSLFEFDAFPDTLSNYTFYVNGEIYQSGSSTRLSTTDLPAGSVNVFVRATDAFGMIESNEINVFVQDKLIDDFEADLLIIHAGNDIVNFNASLNNYNNVSYEWDFGDPDSGIDNFSDLRDPTHQFSGPGNYSIRLTAQNEQGCRDTLEKENLIVYRFGDGTPIIYVPSGFTPNGDGNNDVLYVRGEEIVDLEFYVYNQWGELVFETNSINDGWDGNFKGSPALSCTYTYLVKAEMTSGENVVESGHVSIVR